MDTDYPVRNWIVEGKSLQTVTVQQEDGMFVSVVSTDQSIRKTARTRKLAEEGVIDLFLRTAVRSAANPSQDKEDQEDLRVMRERENGPWIPGKIFLKRHGRR